MSEVIHHYINGAIVEGTSGRFGDVYNPALGEVVRQVAFADGSEVRKAVGAARDAFPAWAGTPPLRRARVMFRLKQLIEANLDAPTPVNSPQPNAAWDSAQTVPFWSRTRSDRWFARPRCAGAW